MHVYLVRHAKAEPGDPDELRPLAKKGRKQAKELGERFARDGIDAVVSSPLLRARETANAIAKATKTNVETDERLAPGATPADVRAVVEGRGERVVVVGHQPDFGRAAAALSGGPEPELPTAGVFELDLK